jgi:hypothetical protein
MINHEEIKSLYKQYLTSLSPYNSLVCNLCGWYYSHPLNYCVKCPGKIIKVQLTVLGNNKKLKQQDKMFRDFMAGFSIFYEKETGEKRFPFESYEYPSKNYYDLTNVLRQLLGIKEVNISKIEDEEDESSNLS